jgi:hypothetical protein
MKKRSTRILTAEQVAQKLHWPVEKWPGNCYAVALAMLEKGIVKGEPRYGHWLGPVKRGTMFYGRGKIVRHGWIASEDKGVPHVIDPTRWVFEGVEPYIYWAPDFEGYYDAGGNVLAEKLWGNQPCPMAAMLDDKGGYYETPRRLRPTLRKVMGILPVVWLTRPQIFWLGNRPLPRLGAHVRPIFQWIVKIEMGAAIPIDNRHIVLGMDE